MVLPFGAVCQQTVFALLKNDIKLAADYYDERNYQGAVKLYLNSYRQNPSDAVQLRIAECYYLLKEYQMAIKAYDNYIEGKQELPLEHLYYYAEAKSATSDYNSAITSYRTYLSKNPGNELILKKIWRLNNIQYLYEDSMHYSIRPVSLNTDLGELCATFYKNDIVFMSNRKQVQLVQKVNAAVNAPFYGVYSSQVWPDTTNGSLQYGTPTVFGRGLGSKFHAGPIAFYENDQKMAFISTGANPERTLQLYFGQLKNGKWKPVNSFPYNSDKYSIGSLSISENGKVLVFSSDMKGGFGGKDLYRSNFENGRWSKPVNLGEDINTAQDEVFPYLQNERTLYFSSNGHAGLGGLDIFKAAIVHDGFDEPQNVGHPLNSSYDDFSLIIDSLDTHGYFSSNRSGGGFNDDLFEFDMDLQTYPVTIDGVIKYKEHTWSDSSALKVLPNAKIYLIDNLRKTTVHESISDSNGKFSIVIPNFSKYVVHVVGEDGDENRAIIEIPKHRKQVGSHEIVLIKDFFKPHKNQE
jgi:hypothetical protein